MIHPVRCSDSVNPADRRHSSDFDARQAHLLIGVLQSSAMYCLFAVLLDERGRQRGGIHSQTQSSTTQHVKPDRGKRQRHGAQGLFRTAGTAASVTATRRWGDSVPKGTRRGPAINPMDQGGEIVAFMIIR